MNQTFIRQGQAQDFGIWSMDWDTFPDSQGNLYLGFYFSRLALSLTKSIYKTTKYVYPIMQDF